MAQLTGKVAYVTAAGGAIAGATARRFAAEGAAVYCIDIDDDTVSQKSRYKALGRRHFAPAVSKCDV